MMKNQLAGLMKQAQQMQDNMKKAQEELANTEVEGQAGAGLVKVVMTCRHAVKRVTIDPSLLADDRDMLEDLVAAAVNDAVLHGMPRDYHVADGDLLTLDLAVKKDGVAADAAISFIVGTRRAPEDEAMIAATEPTEARAP